MKHIAPQKTMFPVRLAVTITITDDATLKLWEAYRAHYEAIDPSNNQLVSGLIVRGLAQWNAGKGAHEG